ncbi:MAG: Asp-tRNA(Asn)/Glu-tRNA(Gln) amidotransferase GatCAB subunit B, partial [Chitinivibrionales bacterium]
RKERYKKDFCLSEEHAGVITEEKTTADYYEEVLKSYTDPAKAANWVMSELLMYCSDKKCSVTGLNTTPKRLAQILKLIDKGTISASAGKKVVKRIEQEDRDPENLIEEMGLKQISETSELRSVVEKLVADNPNEAERLRNGEKKLTGFFVGQAMKATKGKGNPKEINKLLSELI